MKNLISRLETIQRGGPQFVTALLGIGALTTLLLVGAVIGALTVDGDDKTSPRLTAGAKEAPEETLDTVDPGVAPEETVPSTDPTAPGAPGATTGGAGAGAGRPGGSAAGPAGTGGTTAITEAPPKPGEAPLPRGGNATGVTDKAIKYGVHVPLTFNKAPVPLGGPVARGIETYVKFVNGNGGINGRTIDLRIVDDEFTPGGANNAGKNLINDEKVFFIAGTLGVDQIQVVADQSKKAGVPYFAGGGNEPQFGDLRVHQILSSYDTHVTKLAQYMGKDPMYAGKAVGVIVSDTTLIHPAVTNIFKAELEKNGLRLAAVKTVQKPEIQSASGYGDITLDFKSKKVQVVVPLTDPINTAGLVRQCETEGGCPWTYSFTNFAHDSETALTLFNDKWGQLKVRGLSGGCYPNAPAGQINDAGKCGSMGKAKAQFESIRGAGAWTSTQSDQRYGASTGYNSAAGYQWIGFWLKGMKDLGTEVTRERLIASVARYEGYDDLITGPISYKNTPIQHGAEKMVVWEAQTGNKMKMLSDGFVDGF